MCWNYGAATVTEQTGFLSSRTYIPGVPGWLSQFSCRLLISAQVTTSRFKRLSPTVGFGADSIELAWDSLSPSPSAPPLLMLSLSQNKNKNKELTASNRTNVTHVFARGVQGTCVSQNKIEETWPRKGQVGWEPEHTSLDLTMKRSH